MSKLVTLRLTEDPEKLTALRLTKGLRQWGGTKAKPSGPEQYIVRMDGTAYVFEAGKALDLPERIAKSLVRSSGVFAHGTEKQTQWGDTYISAMDSDFVPVLDILDEWEVGTPRRSTICPLCITDQKTVEGLRKHVATCGKEPAKEVAL